LTAQNCYGKLFLFLDVWFLQPDFSKLSLEPKMMWQKFVNNMVYEVTQVVRFCKKLPGKW